MTSAEQSTGNLPKKEDRDKLISAKQVVKITDLFENFMALPPKLNSEYSSAYEEGLEWISKLCGLTSAEQNRCRLAKWGYLAGVVGLEANSHRLKVVVKWFIYVFLFDDQLDDGPLGSKVTSSQKYLDAAVSVLLNEDPFKMYTLPLEVALNTFWCQIREDSEISSGTKNRFRDRMIDYFISAKDLILFEASQNREETLRRYMQHRFYTAGVLPTYSLMQYANCIHVPDEVFENPAFIELEKTAVELLALANDCVSYRRESKQTRPHNLIHFLRYHGMSEQEAYEYLQERLREGYKRWYLALADIPSWGEEIDREVQRYISGMQYVNIGHANYLFESPRYFGKNHAQIRRTRELPLEGDADDMIESVIFADELVI